MKKGFISFILAVATLVVLCQSICFAAPDFNAADYAMINPVESAIADFNAGTTGKAVLGGSVKNADGEAAAEIGGEKCWYFGNTISSSGYGLGTASETNKKFPLYGKGVYSFDLYLAKPTIAATTTGTKVPKNTVMGLYDAAGKRFNETQIAFLPLREEGVIPTQYKISLITTLSESKTNLKFNYDTWYSMKLYVNVTENKFALEIINKSTSQTIEAVANSLPEDYTSIKDFRFINKDATDAGIYADNLQFTREQYVVETPVISFADGRAKATVTVMNETASGVTSPVLLIGTYDVHGKLLDADFVIKNITAREDEADCGITKEELSCEADANGAATARAFVWNTLGNMRPYVNSVNSPVVSD